MAVDFESDNGVFVVVDDDRRDPFYEKHDECYLVILDNKESVQRRHKDIVTGIAIDDLWTTLHEDGTVEEGGDFISEVETLDVATFIAIEDIVDMLKNKPELLKKLQLRRRRV